MRALLDVTPTAEQLSLFSRIKDGVEVIRGAAGSGKTTTALLKLRSLIGSFISRRRRTRDNSPVRILVLTYNRTLAGYVTELANKQFSSDDSIDVEISTFAKWAMRTLSNPQMISTQQQRTLIAELSGNLALPSAFIDEEIEYLTGRFLPASLDEYLTVRRDGRGGTPRMERGLREQLMNEVVQPYREYKNLMGLLDWNDLAVSMSEKKYYDYDIVVVDETQDFSANQIRGIMKQVAETHAVTFVLDTAQRIYARGFTWQEVGVVVRSENSYRLTKNYRNTSEIAALAASMTAGIATDDDGTLPNFAGAERSGDKPLMLVGTYRNQVDYTLNHIKNSIDLTAESVAFLHPKGGQWFDFLRKELKSSGLDFVEITREAEWPSGSENIALSTLHSSKGLEFDHVFVLGLNAQVLAHGDGVDDDKLSTLRRLLAMGIGRAKKSVFLGYKPDEKSDVIDYFNSTTFEKLDV